MPYGKPGTTTTHTVESLTARTTPEPNTGCWIYTGGLNGAGYGRVRHERGYVLTHRLMYELVTGSRPVGLEVCHRCDNPPCCNPDHLFAGTHAQNMADSARKNRTRRGESAKTSRAKLTDADVREIRAKLMQGATRAQMASTYSLTRATICAIHLRHSWKHLEET